MSFLQGLYPYEVVLLVLGVVFFFVLLASFVSLLRRGQPYAGLLPFFVLTIAMIGYPGVKTSNTKDGVITMERTTDQLQRDPTNAALGQTLHSQLTQILNRPTATPQALVAIAGAQFALGDHAGAKTNLAKVPQSVAASPQAEKLKTLIGLDERMTTLMDEVQQHPGNSAAGTELEHVANQVSQLPIASPLLLNRAARAQTLLGNTAAAESLTRKVMKNDPRLLITK